MREHISHCSAAAIWNIPHIETILGPMRSEEGLTDITVSDRKVKSSGHSQKIHLCRFPLPNGAIVQKDGYAISSPELLFLEFASKLNIHKLILLGLQLCSCPPGQARRSITTRRKIEQLLLKTKGYRGNKLALRAIQYVEDGSASIMESISYMILTLPNSMGGFGIKGAVFNYEIKLNSESAKLLGQDRCFADLYYKQARLAVEYDSFAYHHRPSEQGKDAIRSTCLSRQGIKIINLKTVQLYNKVACMDFAVNLARHLGKRIQIRSNNFKQMHAQLRELLPLRMTENDANKSNKNPM